MPDQSGPLPARLQAIVDEFREAEGREKLEMLLEFAAEMPEPPASLRASRAGEPVPECMTAVQVYTEQQDGRLAFYFDVPDEAPTIRGYAAILGEGLRGATPEEVLAVPAGFYLDMGLQQVLTPQRMNGLAAILAHMKRAALEGVERSK